MWYKIILSVLFIGVCGTNPLKAMESEEITKQKTRIYMEGNDKKNPLKIFRLPISIRIKNLSDALCQTASTDLEKIILFMNYINKMKVGTPSTTDLDTVIDESVGACGAFTNVLLALCTVQGMNAKLLGLYNYPKNNGHVVAYIEVEGRFRVFDPTFSGYYVHADAIKPEPLGFEEIKAGYKEHPENIKVISTFNRCGIEQFTGKNIMLHANPSGIIGPEHPMYYPLSIDIKLCPILEKTDFGPKNQGASYVGTACINNNHLWSFKNLTPNTKYLFSIDPDFLGGNIDLNDDRTFLMRSKIKSGANPATLDHVVDCSRGNLIPLGISFTALQEEVTLKLSHPYRGPKFRYLKMKKYELGEIKNIEEKQIFMNANDDKNPLKIFRLPISIGIKNLSNALCQTASTDLDKIILFMNYINKMKVGTPSATDIDTVIDESVGACGAFTNVLLALCAAQGKNGKVLNLCNYPKDQGHTVAYIEVDGRFRVFDPTFAGYYVHANAIKPEPLGFEEIKAGYKANPDNIKLISTFHRNGIQEYTGKNIMLHANPSGIIGPERPMYYPLCIDMKVSSILEKSNFGPKNQGASYIGSACINNNHLWSFKNLTPNTKYLFSIDPEFFGGDIDLNDDRKFLMRSKIKSGANSMSLDHVINCSIGNLVPLDIPFTALKEEVILKLSHPYRGPKFRYLSVKKFELREIKL